jgi:hypothetical protein
VFQQARFEDALTVTEDIIRVVTSSSMVSVFEKPQFRDLVHGLSALQRARLCSHVYQLLHEDMSRGFEALADFLKPAKLAKWTIVTLCPYYYRPEEDVFIKPTTTKGILEYFEIKHLKYNAAPAWNFYRGYSDVILSMKEKVSHLLSPDNAFFCGLLMWAMG